jgi:serine/threonine protein kinase
MCIYREYAHGDLKPENILLDGAFRTNVCDFGVSRIENCEDPATGDTGTHQYAAPEQLYEGFPHTTKTDVLTFGLVLDELLGRVSVFGSELSLAEIVRRHLRDYPPDIPAKFGPVMQRLIIRCWSNSPESRRSFHAIFDEFDAIGFHILPDANASAIKAAVSKVIEWERNAGCWT